MSVSGLCQICQSAEADTRCDRCGTMVCAEHLNREYGICLECAREAGVGGGRGDGRGTGEDHPDVDRYTF